MKRNRQKILQYTILFIFIFFIGLLDPWIKTTYALDSRYREVGSFNISAYTAGAESTGKNPGDPGYGVTASGAYVTSNRTIATDWSVLPKGTVIKIEGIDDHLFVVEDTGGAIQGNRIDIYMENYSDAIRWGRKDLRVWVLDNPGTMDPIVPSSGQAPTGGGNYEGDGGMDVSGIIAKAIIWILEPFVEFLTNSTYSITELVFNLNKEGTADNGLAYGLFSEAELQDIIKVGMNGVQLVCYTFLALGIIHYAYLVTRSGTNDRIRSELMTNTISFTFVGFMLNNIGTLYDMFFLFNQALVNTFRKKVGAIADFQNPMSGDELVDLVILLMFVGLGLWANFYYIMRKFVIMILMITGPVFITVSVFPQFRGITGTWARELFSNIISQSIHAIMLWIFLIMAASNSGDWLLQIVFLATFIPISETIKSLMGASSATGQMAGAASIAALGTAAQAAGATSNIIGAAGIPLMNAGSQFLSRLRGGTGGGLIPGNTGYTPPGASNVSDFQAGQGGVGNGLPVSPLTPFPLTPNVKANRMLAIGKGVGRLVSTVGGIAGGIAGLPLGGTGSIMGASLGSNLGSTVGTLGGRALGGTLNLSGSTMNEAEKIYMGMQQAYSKNGSGSVLDRMKAIGQGGYQASSISKPINEIMSAAQQASAAYQTGGIREMGGSLGASFQKNAENIHRTLRDTTAFGAGAILGENGFNSTYQLMQQQSPFNPMIENGTISMEGLKQQYKSGNVKRMKLMQSIEGTFVVGRTRGEDGKFGRLTRLSKVGEANPLLKDGESITRKVDFDPSGRFQFVEHPTLKGSNGVEMDARNIYQPINPYSLFQNPYTSFSENRRKRDTLSEWARTKGIGGIS